MLIILTPNEEKLKSFSQILVDYIVKIINYINMKILIVEDDRSIRNVLKMGLESEGYIVDEAEDGESGSYLARINPYGLIILDIVMPKKSGTEVCRELREYNIDTPILMLTSKSDVLTKIQLLNIGADDYITKPFSFEELIARIKAVSRRPSAIEDDILRNGNITLNVNTQEVLRNKKKVYLTRKEILLLELFMKNKDKVVSRASIMEHVWETDMNPFSNTIEAHILSLRKKIGDAKKNLIRSVPGRGYRMMEVEVKALV